MSSTRQPVAVVVGATSKWQADGRNTKLAHGKALDDRDLPVGVRWGVGGASWERWARGTTSWKSRSWTRSTTGWPPSVWGSGWAGSP